MEVRVPVFERIGGQKNVVCSYWLAGRCNRNPCRFLHSEKSKLVQPKLVISRKAPPRKTTWKSPGYNNAKSGAGSSNGVSVNGVSGSHAQPGALTAVREVPEISGARIAQPRQCKEWVNGICVHGDKCKDVHSWFSGSGFTMLAKLEGHTKGVTGISLPSGCDKLYTCSKDKSIQAWDCHSGQCAGSLTMDSEVGCLITEGPWVLVGLQNGVKAWNLQNQAEFSLNGPPGLVYSMVTDDGGKLFAGAEDGSILVWKWHPESANNPQLITMLKEHRGAINSLVVGSGNRLYSGSKDCTVKVWDCQTFQCLHSLNGHTRDVMSVLCWDSYLISASLDNTLKVWALTEEGIMDVVYERKEESGVIALRGMHDAEHKPILLCSCNDDTVRLYDLPSFMERGRIFSRGEVEVIETGVNGLFFTGDATGEVSVWNLLGVPSATASS